MEEAAGGAARLLRDGGELTHRPAGTDDPAFVPPVVEEPPGLGGTIRARLWDFCVEEIPLHRPAGHGEHVLFQIEKRNLSTFDALLRLSKALKVSEHSIGYGGLKDARAITSQYFTAAKIPLERVQRIRHPGMRVLSVEAHDRALKIGHLRGNRFAILLMCPPL